MACGRSTKSMGLRRAIASCSRWAHGIEAQVRASDSLAHLGDDSSRCCCPATASAGACRSPSAFLRPCARRRSSVAPGSARGDTRLDRHRRMRPPRLRWAIARPPRTSGWRGREAALHRAKRARRRSATKSALRWRNISSRKIGTPTSAVSAPTGNCLGASSTREARSAAISTRPPSSAEPAARRGCRCRARAARGAA